MDETNSPAVEDQIPAENTGGDSGTETPAANEPAQDAPDMAAQIASLQTQVASYQADATKRDIAEEFGLPAGTYKRIMGENEAEWREDAKVLQRLFSAQKRMTVPGVSYEHANADNPIKNALRSLLSTNEGGI